MTSSIHNQSGNTIHMQFFALKYILKEHIIIMTFEQVRKDKLTHKCHLNYPVATFPAQLGKFLL